MNRQLVWSYKGEVYVSDVVCPCPVCGADAVGKCLAEQPDGTTHVCLPCAGGCNTGFEVVPFVKGGDA